MSAVALAAARLNATPADIPGLWNAPGYPELTTGQLLNAAGFRLNPFADGRGGVSLFQMQADDWLEDIL